VSAAPGTRQAWALGQFVMPAQGLVFYLVHFSGLYWAKGVTFAPEFQLDGVSAVSGNVAWLWGYDQPGADFTSDMPFLARMSDGVVRQVHQAFLKNVYVWALASDGAAEAWLVGGARDRHGRFEGVVAARWDGTSWHQVPAPAGVAGSASDGLMSLSISGRSDAWVVSRPVPVKPRLLHWDGMTWSRSYTPPASLSRSGSVPSGCRSPHRRGMPGSSTAKESTTRGAAALSALRPGLSRRTSTAAPGEGTSSPPGSRA